MKAAFLALACLATADSNAQSVQVFGVDLQIRANCEIVVQHKDRPLETVTSPLSGTQCRILPNSETNVPRLEFIQGEYVLLLESMLHTADTCRAELAAITVSRDGRIRLSPKRKRTSACGSAERKDFEILRHHSGK